MNSPAEILNIDIRISQLAPVKLTRDASEKTCGLFLPYTPRLALGLVVNLEGETQLIHLDGAHIFKMGSVAIGSPIRGVIISDYEFRVDTASRYNSTEQSDELGALILKGGELFLMCGRLGESYHGDLEPVLIQSGLLAGTDDEACGFKKWSVTIREGEETKVIRSFESIANEL